MVIFRLLVVSLFCTVFGGHRRRRRRVLFFQTGSDVTFGDGASPLPPMGERREGGREAAACKTIRQLRLINHVSFLHHPLDQKLATKQHAVRVFSSCTSFLFVSDYDDDDVDQK